MTFAKGICCTAADGTNCRSPARVCATNATCSGQAPYTVCAGAVGDDGQVAGTSSASYPGAYGSCYLNATNTGVARNLSGGKYQVNQGLLQWDTSALPDNAMVTSAALTIWSSSVTDTDSRNLQGEWFNWGATCNASDWTPAGGTGAFSLANSTITAGAFNTIALDAVYNVSRTGRTYLRLSQSGGLPTGINRVVFDAFESTKRPGPSLQVCY
jgi:hypothetical protein